MKPEKFNSISDVVAIVYCERQVVLDRLHGTARTEAQHRTAAAGRIEHQRFAKEGASAQDRRCFIATAIYGGDAPETVWLRHWRDNRLMPSRPGRVLVRVYYALSPLVVRLIEKAPCSRAFIRRALELVLSRLKA